ncbi:MAG: sugar phosphate isomerase/epimerase [Oscillospiraceae bacterium]|nr:sugar phosphate isomerase/epimerase [Oscillospiraceae bacterium]
MKLAFSTLGCPGWSWNEIFATAKDMGLNGIEIRGIGGQIYAPSIKVFADEQLEATKAQINKSGMELPMLTSGASLGLPETEKNMAEAKAYIDLAEKLGSSFVRVMVTPVAQVEPANLEQAVRLYSELCEYAAPKGVIPLIETNSVLADSKVMKQFMEDCTSENCGVLWDIHHPYRFFGESPEETYANIGKWVKYTHVKDSVMKDGQVSYRMMGYGDVPIMDTLQILHRHGYKGYITLEWLKRWCPDLQEPGIVFSHFSSYMSYLITQL